MPETKKTLRQELQKGGKKKTKDSNRKTAMVRAPVKDRREEMVKEERGKNGELGVS